MIRKGMNYTNAYGWRCVALSGVTKYGVVLVRYTTGPLKGREARIMHDAMTAEVVK